MAFPFLAFTSLDGKAYACVYIGASHENYDSVWSHAQEQIDTSAGGIHATAFNMLHQNLAVLKHGEAFQPPFNQYIKVIFDLDWIQAQADEMKTNNPSEFQNLFGYQ